MIFYQIHPKISGPASGQDIHGAQLLSGTCLLLVGVPSFAQESLRIYFYSSLLVFQGTNPTGHIVCSRRLKQIEDHEPKGAKHMGHSPHVWGKALFFSCFPSKLTPRGLLVKLLHLDLKPMFRANERLPATSLREAMFSPDWSAPWLPIWAVLQHIYCFPCKCVAFFPWLKKNNMQILGVETTRGQAREPWQR